MTGMPSNLHRIEQGDTVVVSPSSLPKLVQFEPVSSIRARLHAVIDQALDTVEECIGLLDMLDGDPDLEAEIGEDQDVVPVTLNPERMQPVRKIRPRS